MSAEALPVHVATPHFYDSECPACTYASGLRVVQLDEAERRRFEVEKAIGASLVKVIACQSELEQARGLLRDALLRARARA